MTNLHDETSDAPQRLRCLSCGSWLTDELGVNAATVVPSNTSSAPPGFDSKRLQIIDLGPEIGVTGRGLRMSRVTVSPGAYFAAHSHRDQPEIIHVLEGVLTEERNGGPAIDHGQGSVLTMTKEVVHTLANRTEFPTVYISTSVKR